MTVYRGAKTDELGRGVNIGTWVSPSEEYASKYGNVWSYEMNNDIKLLSVTNECKSFNNFKN